MIGSISPLLQAGGRVLGSVLPRARHYTQARNIFDMIQPPPIEFLDTPPPYNLGIPLGSPVSFDPYSNLPDPNRLQPVPDYMPPGVSPEVLSPNVEIPDYAKPEQKPESLSADVARLIPSRLGSAVPDRGTIGERITDKIFDFLRGYGQSRSYGEGLARGVQAMSAGAEQREARYQQKKAYMEQGFTEAQAEAMLRDPKYRDKMIEQQTKLQSLEASRLGKDMEVVRDDAGKVIGQRVIKGSPTYMKRREDYIKSQEGVQIVSVFTKRFLKALDTAEGYLTGENIKDGKVVGISGHLPTTGRIAQLTAYIDPTSYQGQTEYALRAVKNDQILNELNSLRAMAKSGASGLGQTTHKELEVLAGVYGPIGIQYDAKQMLEAIRKMRQSIKTVLKVQSDYAESLHPDRLYKPGEQLPEPFSVENFLLDLLKNKQDSSGQSGHGLPVMSFDEAAKNVEIGGVFQAPDGKFYRKKAKTVQ